MFYIMKSIAYISSSPNSILWFLKNEITLISKYANVYILSNKSDSIQLLCERNNIKFIELDFSRRISFIRDFISVIKLIKIIKKKDISLIKTITLKAGFIGIIAGVYCRVSTRYHIVAGIPWLRKNLFIKIFSYFFEIPTMLMSTHIQTDSFEQKNLLHKLYRIKEKIIIFNKGSLCGVPDNKIDSKFKNKNREKMRKIFSINRRQKVLIYAGRICKDKGINELVEAFNKLNNEDNNNSYLLILLGLIEKKYDKISKKTLSLIKINKNIIHIDHRKNVFPYFQMSDLLIIPSYGEGFGNVVIEANASGLPVLGTNVRGLNESIIDYYNGIKVESHSSESIIQGIKLIFSDNELYTKLKSNGLENVIKNFRGSQINNMSVCKMKEIIS